MKKLFCVTIVVYVMAGNESDAKRIGAEYCAADSAEAYIAESVASEWYDYIPFGSDDDMTCGDILKAQRAADAEKAK